MIWDQPDAPKFLHASAQRPQGSWHVEHPFDVTYFSWQPSVPKGMTWEEVFDHFDALSPQDPAYGFYRAMLPGMIPDQHYAASHAEARLVCQWLEDEAEIAGDVPEILARFGFQQGDQEGHQSSFERPLGSGVVSLRWDHDPVGLQSMKLTYQGPTSSRWWNLLRLTHTKTTNTAQMIFPWPFPRPMATFAGVCGRLVDLRAKNGPRRYHKPSL